MHQVAEVICLPDFLSMDNIYQLIVVEGYHMVVQIWVDIEKGNNGGGFQWGSHQWNDEAGVGWGGWGDALLQVFLYVSMAVLG